MDDYKWADLLFNSCPKYETGFTQLLAQTPYHVPFNVYNLYEKRFTLIKEFQKISLELFRQVLKKKEHSVLLNWLINESPISLGLRYHQDLEDRHYTLPVFFRTDEVAPGGRIVEIQCPGSLWGDLQLTFDYLTRLKYQVDVVSPANLFGNQLIRLLNEKPIVHHLLDNASGQAGMRYFIEKTRPLVRYYGVDYGIWPKNCNFIRSHSFFGLYAENEFKTRIARVGNGIVYDLPPHVLFDQKASLVLPFWSLTRKAFTDDIRDLFVYTTPLLPSGIELPDNTKITIEQFSRLPRSQRSFYVKYAGSDVSMNWGSRAVFRLSNLSQNNCLSLLRKCTSHYERGQIWLIQKEETHDDEIVFLDRQENRQSEKLRAKISGFYGPFGPIGILAMHRGHNKVHGQNDTVVSFMVPEEREGDSA